MASAVDTKVASGETSAKKEVPPGVLSPAHGSDTDDDHLVSWQDGIVDNSLLT